MLCISGCGNSLKASATHGDNGASNPKVVAQVGSHAVSLEQLDETLGRALYDNRVFALRGALLTLLLGQEAALRKSDPDTVLASYTSPPTIDEDELRRNFTLAKERGHLPADVSYETYVDGVTSVRERHADQFRNRRAFRDLARRHALRIDYKALGLMPSTISSSGPSDGSTEGAFDVTIFDDYASTYSERGSAELRKVLARFPGQLRVRYRVYPKRGSAASEAAAEAVLCAAAQGKFFEYRQAILADARERQRVELESLAAAVGVNQATFAQCLERHEQAALVADHVKDYESNSLQGVPAWVINGFVLGGVVPSTDLTDFIEDIRDGVFL